VSDSAKSGLRRLIRHVRDCFPQLPHRVARPVAAPDLPAAGVSEECIPHIFWHSSTAKRIGERVARAVEDEPRVLYASLLPEPPSEPLGEVPGLTLKGSTRSTPASIGCTGTRRRDEAVLSRRASCGRMSKYRTPSSSRRSSGRRPTISPRRHPEYRPINGTQRKGPSSGSDSMRLRACSGVKGSRRSSPVAAGASVAATRRPYSRRSSPRSLGERRTPRPCAAP